MAKLHRHPWWSRCWSSQLRWQCRAYLSRSLHTCCHGDDDIRIGNFPLEGKEYKTKRPRWIRWPIWPQCLGPRLTRGCGGEFCPQSDSMNELYLLMETDIVYENLRLGSTHIIDNGNGGNTQEAVRSMHGRVCIDILRATTWQTWQTWSQSVAALLFF